MPSACATCMRSFGGAAGDCFQIPSPDCTDTYCEDEFLLKYWSHVRQHVERLVSHHAPHRRKPPPLIVTHGHASWQDFFASAVIRTLAKQPAEFVARVVIATIEEPWGRWPEKAELFTSQARPLPTFVVVPYSIHTSSIIRHSTERSSEHQRPFAAIFQGRVHGSFDGTRRRIVEQMLEAGGFCTAPVDVGPDEVDDKPVVCVLCEGKDIVRCHRSLNATAGLCPQADTDDPEARWGCCAIASLAIAARATFCIEPTSDDLMRSHFYLGMQSGCIPVLFDGSGDVNDPVGHGGMTGIVRQPTRWAWRQEELLAKVARTQGDDDLARRANYSAFAIAHFAADLNEGKLPGLAKHLLALATRAEHAERLARLRAAVDRAAPLMRWAPPPGMACEEEPCDAFSALAMTVHAISVEQRKRTARSRL